MPTRLMFGCGDTAGSLALVHVRLPTPQAISSLKPSSLSGLALKCGSTDVHVTPIHRLICATHRGGPKCSCSWCVNVTHLRTHSRLQVVMGTRRNQAEPRRGSANHRL